jgi:hypothetical protein
MADACLLSLLSPLRGRCASIRVWGGMWALPDSRWWTYTRWPDGQHHDERTSPRGARRVVLSLARRGSRRAPHITQHSPASRCAREERDGSGGSPLRPAGVRLGAYADPHAAQVAALEGAGDVWTPQRRSQRVLAGNR